MLARGLQIRQRANKRCIGIGINEQSRVKKRRLSNRLLAGLALTCLPVVAFAAPKPVVRNQGEGHLIINRLPNLGGGIGAFISIDGATVGRIGWGQSYSQGLPAGAHFVSITVEPNFLFRGPAEQRLTVESGRNYLLTLKWKGDRLILK